ncbi:hypothetical protein F2P81_003915 [Scophthalmus maximus]|uniref:Uncharacterized protein n=1 Tax=Scophthalmus maximus TaxID=52904 RepID=A0A6A4TDV4_SCOMX|nr:hypothetical protein F2P81_003915 [Scophthalmus maximus]
MNQTALLQTGEFRDHSAVAQASSLPNRWMNGDAVAAVAIGVPGDADQETDSAGTVAAAGNKESNRATRCSNREFKVFTCEPRDPGTQRRRS